MLVMAIEREESATWRYVEQITQGLKSNWTASIL